MMSTRMLASLRRHYSSSLKEHQKKMMAKGLPKKRKLDGVKHAVLVSSAKVTWLIRFGLELKLCMTFECFWILSREASASRRAL